MRGLADLFWWWSDVPAYDRRDYHAFWERLTSPSQWDFEHTAYMCFKLLTANWTIGLINPVLVSYPERHPELQTTDEFKVIKRFNRHTCCGLQGASLAAQLALEREYGYSFQVLNGHGMFHPTLNGHATPAAHASKVRASRGNRWLILQLDHGWQVDGADNPPFGRCSGCCLAAVLQPLAIACERLRLQCPKVGTERPT